MPMPHRKVSTAKIQAAFERLPYDMTQHDVAIKAGLSDVSISHYRSGARRPTAKNLPKLAKGLGVAESDLIED